MQDEYTGSRVGDRLRTSIEGRGWTLAAFARRSKIPYRSLQDYVGGKSKPGFDQIAKFAEFGLDVVFILTGQPLGNLANPLPPMFDYGSYESGSRPYKQQDADAILDKIESKFTLKDWIDIWNFANDHVPEVEVFSVDERRRNAGVAFVAAGLVLGLVDRIRKLGWIAK